ncbi:MAG: EI24 domain-containing protein [Hydrogenophaga sp.]|jgi:hypothetical protein|nr:EI24 domain-containing protein [Hydrogenophaga sp.]
MALIFDSFWRALVYCLHPRVLGLSVLPLVLLVVLSLGLGYLFWDSAVETTAGWLGAIGFVAAIQDWLVQAGMAWLAAAIAPLLLLMLVTPVLALLCLLLVAMLMTPAMVGLVAKRRFASLERRYGGSLLYSVLWSLGSTLLAMVALVVSMPLWWIPPLVLILPPVIWGWLAYRIFAFDALASHATADERKRILQEQRRRLFVMGVLSGYLGAAPGLLWVYGALSFALAPLLVPLAIWLYTLMFALASLWFAHYLLTCLARLRTTDQAQAVDAQSPAASGSEPPVLLGPLASTASDKSMRLPCTSL